MICGNPEMLGDGSVQLRLFSNRPLIYIRDTLPGVSKAELWGWLKEAHARWGAVCDWQAALISDLNDAGDAAVQIVEAADLGRGGVLADQMLPSHGYRHLRMRINTRIKWKATDGQMASGTVDPIRTICHEIGHFQGHSHWPVGRPLELMEPTVSQQIIAPQPSEARVSAGWFGEPKLPKPAPSDELVIRVRNGMPSIDGYRVTKLEG